MGQKWKFKLNNNNVTYQRRNNHPELSTPTVNSLSLTIITGLEHLLMALFKIPVREINLQDFLK